MTIAVDKGYKWYRFQKDLLDKFYEKQKLAVLISRQCGKTEFGAKLIGDFLFRYAKRKNPRALICMVSQQQAFDFYFKRIDESLRHLPKSVYYKQGGKDQPLVIYFKRPHFGDIAQVTIVGIGNAKSLRGGTMDFMILDEMASYPPKLWKSIFEPMVDRTDGKVLLTSTPNGRNLFYDLCMDFKKRGDKGDPEVGFMKYDIYEAQVHTDEWIEKRRKSYEVINRMDEWHQEYECSFDAAAIEVAPFANKVHRLSADDKFIPDNHLVLHMMNTVNVAVDIGAAGNMAAWHWVKDPITGDTAVKCYTDHHTSLRALVDDLYKQYSPDNTHIHIVFPVDVNTPAIADGGTYASVVMEHIAKQRYERIMQVSHLPKVKNKQILWRQGLEMWNRCVFYAKGCMEGLHKLSGIRFKEVPSTGEIKYGEAIPNGNQHAGDAFLYMCAAIADSVVPVGGMLPPDLDEQRMAVPVVGKYTANNGTRPYRRKSWF